MSVNIDLAFTVTGLAGEPQAREIVGALEELMRDESIDGYVRITLDVGADGACLVSGKSRYPLSISGFHRWQPHFEGSSPSRSPKWPPLPGRRSTGVTRTRSTEPPAREPGAAPSGSPGSRPGRPHGRPDPAPGRPRNPNRR